MKKIGVILVLITFYIQSIIIIPLLWTIPGIKRLNKMNKGTATESDETVAIVLGIIFGVLLAWIGVGLILIDNYSNKNKITSSEDNKTTTV